MPPFQKRVSDGGAAAAGMDQQDSGLSPKTLEMLTGRQYIPEGCCTNNRGSWFLNRPWKGADG